MESIPSSVVRHGWFALCAGGVSAILGACASAESTARASDAGSTLADAEGPIGEADAGPAPSDASADVTSVEVPWADVPSAPGASVRTRGGAGSSEDVLVLYGGCGASAAATRGFADALATASTWGARPPRYLYAIEWTSSGCGYDGLFKNSLLGPLVLGKAGGTGKVTLLAHSSGAYVAHEWLAQAIGAKPPAWDPGHTLRGRLAYFNLDGGGDANLTLVTSSAENVPVFFVGAKDSATGLVSRNHATMKALGGANLFFEVDATGSGCTASNCLHDAVITTLPHNRKSFVDGQGTSKPLWCDYKSFPTQLDSTCVAIDEQKDRAASRAIVASYLSKR